MQLGHPPGFFVANAQLPFAIEPENKYQAIPSQARTVSKSQCYLHDCFSLQQSVTIGPCPRPPQLALRLTANAPTRKSDIRTHAQHLLSPTAISVRGPDETSNGRGSNADPRKPIRCVGCISQQCARYMFFRCSLVCCPFANSVG